jgi:chemotaxis protein MotB
MSKDPFSKLQSSLTLEELLDQQSSRSSQNWLLTYLDVFVLVVMLVITLITLTDIKSEQKAAKKSSSKSNAASATVCPPVSAPVVSCPTPTAANNNSPAQNSTEPKTETKPENAKTDGTLKQENQSLVATASNPAENKSPTENILNPPPPSDSSQTDTTDSPDKNKVQQLTKAINESGLNKAVNIQVNQGYVQLEIQDSVLFKSSEADLTASGGALLKRLIPFLKQTEGVILIEGHTDNVPIKTARFTSNWELGASRATSVLHFLVLQQLDSSRLRAMTYADTMPIADNSTPEGREKNRRVNILIKLSE